MRKEIADKIDYNSILFRILDRINISGLSNNLAEYRRGINLFYTNIYPYLEDSDKETYQKMVNKRYWDRALQELLIVADKKNLLLEKENIEKI